MPHIPEGQRELLVTKIQTERSVHVQEFTQLSITSPLHQYMPSTVSVTLTSMELDYCIYGDQTSHQCLQELMWRRVSRWVG